MARRGAQVPRPAAGRCFDGRLGQGNPCGYPRDEETPPASGREVSQGTRPIGGCLRYARGSQRDSSAGNRQRRQNSVLGQNSGAAVEGFNHDSPLVVSGVKSPDLLRFASRFLLILPATIDSGIGLLAHCLGADGEKPSDRRNGAIGRDMPTPARRDGSRVVGQRG